MTDSAASGPWAILGKLSDRIRSSVHDAWTGILGARSPIRSAEGSRLAEGQLAPLRLVVVLVTAGLYLTVLDGTSGNADLAYALAGLATVYAAATVWASHRSTPIRRLAPGATVAADALLIGGWILATGGLASPFHVLWYVSIATVAYRFPLPRVAGVAVAYVSIHGLVALGLGQLPGALPTLLLHSAYIPLAGALAALTAALYEDRDRARLAERTDAQARNLSASEKARARIAAVEEKWRSILENAPNVVMMVDDEGLIEYINLAETAEEQAAIEGAPATDWLPERAHERFEQALDRVLEEDQTVSFEIESRRTGARPGWSLVRMGPITREGEAVGASLVATDISEHRAAERSLEAHVRELERSRELIAQYTRLASHDLQEPLRDIAHYSTLLEQELSDELSEEAIEYGSYAVEGAKRIRALVDGLRRFSELDRSELDRRRVDTESLVEAVLDRLEATELRQEARIEVDELPHVHADPSHLEIALEELIDNALRYAGPEPHVRVGGRREGERAVLWIEDDGPGIPESYRGRVLEPFRRLHAWHDIRGVGVGLALARRVATRHGGRVWIDHADGGGTRVLLSIPDPDPDPHALPPIPGAETPARGTDAAAPA